MHLQRISCAGRRVGGVCDARTLLEDNGDTSPGGDGLVAKAAGSGTGVHVRHRKGNRLVHHRYGAGSHQLAPYSGGVSGDYGSLQSHVGGRYRSRTPPIARERGPIVAGRWMSHRAYAEESA